MIKAILVLEDGAVFWGKGYSENEETIGEIVFNTGMTGYQEVLTDPSYKGQIVTMTYPLIGNYGVTKADEESKAPMVEGFIVRELCEHPSNFRSEEPLLNYLKRHNIMIVSEMDTRAITLHIREGGAMRGILSTSCFDIDTLLARVKQYPTTLGRDIVQEVSCTDIAEWEEDEESAETHRKYEPLIKYADKKEFKVIAFDCGIKKNMLRLLDIIGCSVTVVPASTSLQDIKALNPDGIFLSNGPGDPEPVSYVIKTVRELSEQYPIFGICLGHQIIGLACGAKTYKMKFGHRGINHPVKDLTTGEVEITTQNHGFAIDIDSLDANGLELTHLNLNDQTVEGFKHKNLPIFAVQYHPESSAGPHDSRYLFNRFIEQMRVFKEERK
ncbi:MAG: glutamine-hydrolyzing carbamoyl-phosphate synthase small subunit [Candidatus Auribacterota bacterium]|jgi:carbamoyl-phosphate synthase small subunit|nr:glutamine-hydrolyzing carbamoyl-phosphate synthase small subunit [Candidatus Auribacterota bacterium]